MKTKILLTLAAGVAVVAMMQCGPDTKPDDQTTETHITPVALPTDIVPGFNFPEDSNLIYSWISDTVFNDAAIYAHAWGIWAGLTDQTNQVYQGDTLRVFETWLGLGEIQSIIQDSMLKSGEEFNMTSVKTTRTPLKKPTQLHHAAVNGAAIDTTDNQLLVSVAYSPAAAGFAISNSIMRQDVINTFYKPGGIGYVKPFPNDAITLKPTYFYGQPTDSLIRIPVWPGDPDSAMAFPSSEWNCFVYADTTNSQVPGKSLVPVIGTNPTAAQVEAATCNLTDFIHYNIDSAMAAYLNFSQSVQGAQAVAGDVAILVCMHVATKEISNWTWQSFYWDPNPSSPLFPGSNLSKPQQLTGAPAHYSAIMAYAMLAPNQPISGGSNDPKLKPVIGFNPYLEAVFPPGTFSAAPNQYQPTWQYGVQTNCMSCHAFAAYTPTISLDSQQNILPNRYSTNQYVDMSDTSYFNNYVLLDFAWSLQSTIFAVPEKK